MTRKLTCISCPTGCELEVTQEKEGLLSVTGHQCPRGEEYAREEVTAPKRIVTTTVAIEGMHRRRVPVRTDKPLPVEEINNILMELHSMTLELPVHRGDILIVDFKGTKVNVMASLSIR